MALFPPSPRCLTLCSEPPGMLIGLPWRLCSPCLLPLVPEGEPGFLRCQSPFKAPPSDLDGPRMAIGAAEQAGQQVEVAGVELDFRRKRAGVRGRGAHLRAAALLGLPEEPIAQGQGTGSPAGD